MTAKHPRVAVISLGGTWNCIREGDVLKPAPLIGPFSLAEVFKFYDVPAPPRTAQKVQDLLWDRQLAGLCESQGYGLFILDSTNMGPPHWTRVADWILDNEAEWNCFVVATGTDTMAYLAAALAFALRGLGKPVIVTGAQKPRIDAGSDALPNLVNALKVATLSKNTPDTYEPALPEVAIVFGSRIIRATRARKFSERDLGAFRSINVPDLGSIRLDIKLDPRMILPPIPKGNKWKPASPRPTAFDAEVALLYLFPGITGNAIESFCESCKARVVVLAAFGAGNIPEGSDEGVQPLNEAVQHLTGRGIPVVITTSCVVGAAEFKAHTYAGGEAARNAHAIIANDMLPEVAYVKAKWLASNAGVWLKKGPEAESRVIRMSRFREAMLMPMVGEITPTKQLQRIWGV